MENITTTLSSFFQTLSVDVVIIAGLALVLFFIGVSRGRSRLITILISTYIATLILLVFPRYDLIQYNLGTILGRYDVFALLLLVGVIGVVQIVIDYIVEIEYSSRTLRKTFDTVILAISTAVALLAAVYFTGAAVETSGESLLGGLFTNQNYAFALLVAPLISLFITTRN